MKHSTGFPHIMRELIAENPNYDKYYFNLRWMLWNDNEALEEAGQSENELVKAMFNKEVPDEEFMESLANERGRDSRVCFFPKVHQRT